MMSRHPASLDRARPGDRLLVGSIAEQHRAALAAEGLVCGVLAEVESAVPFGGPIVVRIGRARLAVARAAARGVTVSVARAPAAAAALSATVTR
jgi:Fe2+ transport system protein FeoA